MLNFYLSNAIAAQVPFQTSKYIFYPIKSYNIYTTYYLCALMVVVAMWTCIVVCETADSWTCWHEQLRLGCGGGTPSMELGLVPMGDSVSYLETAGTEMGCGWVVLRQLGVLMPLETYLGVGAGAGISVGVVIHQMCLILWTWRKLANEINVKNAPKIC